MSDRIQKLAQTPISPDAWIGIKYHPNRVNFKDRIVALAEAQGLTQIHLPNTLTEINKFAFYGCRALTQIQIPSGITAIPQGVLQNCSALQSVQLPAGVESIGQNAFRSCAALKTPSAV